MDNQNLESRTTAITALSTVAIQAWKARWTFGEANVEPTGSPAFWNRIITELYGDYCPLNINKYVGSFPEYCKALYDTCHRAPLVDAIPVICSYGIDTTDRIVDLMRTLGIRLTFTAEWYRWMDLHYSILYMNGVWGKNLKYHVQWLFNSFEDQPQSARSDLIVGEDGFLVFGSKPRRAIIRRIQGHALRKLEGRFTVLQGFKKSLLPLDIRDWRESLNGTMEALQTPPTPMDAIIEYQMVRTGRELKAKAPKKITVKPTYTLSKSACVEQRRVDGGYAYEFYRQQSLDRQDRMDIYYRISIPTVVGHVRYDRVFKEHLIYARSQYSYMDVFEDHTARNNIQIMTFSQWQDEFMMKTTAISEACDEFAYNPESNSFQIAFDFNQAAIERWKTLPIISASPLLDHTDLVEHRVFKNDVENVSKLFGRLEDDIAKVEMRTIPEPFKFRSISVGEYEVYSTLLPWQKYMWKNLQKFPCFSLTGLGSDTLLACVQEIITKYWDVGMKFLSGDYKDATNKLSSRAAKILCRSWFSDKPDLLVTLEKSLFRSRISNEKVHLGVTGLVKPRKYKPGVGPDGEVCKRKDFEVLCSDTVYGGPILENYEMCNGQLMGHPLSFPILCAVNAAVCRYALEQAWGRTFSLDDLPLLINGDDCLLIGNNNLQPIWREITQQCGLIESVGKSYFSDRFAMINSRYLLIDSVPFFPERDKLHTEQEGSIPDRYFGYVKYDVGYVNQGILVGRKKGSNVDCEVNISEKVTDQSAFKFWQSASANFSQMGLRCKKLIPDLGRYVTSFKRFFSKIPLYLHMSKDKGGFGFPTMSGKEEMSSYYIERNPFKTSIPGSVLMGEAYACGGISSVFDDQFFPDFLEESKRVRKIIDSGMGPCPKDLYERLLRNYPELFSEMIKEPESTWNVHVCCKVRHVGRQPRQGWRSVSV